MQEGLEFPMKVLVTGGTGYLGRAIVRSLMARGHQPIVLARRAALDLPCRTIEGDVRDHRAMRDVVRGVDGVIHAAALVSMWQADAADFDRTNVGGLETLLDVCSLENTGRIVVTSSFLARPPAGATRALEANDYQRSKVRAREVARAAAARGLPVVTIVPGVIYGPGPDSEANLVGRLFREHLAGRLPGLIGADRIWSFSFVDDVADVHVRALESGGTGEEYIAGGENLPQMRAFELLRAARGTPLPRRIPGALAHLLAAWEETVAARRRPPRVTRGTVKILLHDWPLDNARSIQKLNYRVTALDVGINRVLAALA
jgi:nucleoside-diphosphate-sugar epimerase